MWYLYSIVTQPNALHSQSDEFNSYIFFGRKLPKNQIGFSLSILFYFNRIVFIYVIFVEAFLALFDFLRIETVLSRQFFLLFSFFIHTIKILICFDNVNIFSQYIWKTELLFISLLFDSFHFDVSFLCHLKWLHFGFSSLSSFSFSIKYDGKCHDSWPESHTNSSYIIAYLQSAQTDTHIQM